MKQPKFVEDETFKKAEGEVRLAAYFARAFIKEVGKKKAMKVIGQAYEEYMVDEQGRRYKDVPSNPEARMEALANRFRQAAKDNPALTLKELSPKRVAIEIHRCPVHEVYTKYGIGDVCQKYCDSDYPAARAIHPKIALIRDKEIAYGAEYCNHSWVLEE
ncbi:MAG: L-2-amino-thiazoline-4-carboxylic acid hydrolase [Chloroflexi bacterium]|nr:L-2-amino-thiazoline-4-carboxylic acid hydrolase [Chloroflexota bacterium]